MNVKKNSKEEDFRNYSFMVQDIAGILASLDLEAVIVEIYSYSGTQEEKADIIKRICASFQDNGEKKFVICTRPYASTEEFSESEYYDPGNRQGGRTSYFAQLRKIKAMDGAVSVAVCRYLPDWYKGAVYKKVAPSYVMLAGMKNADTREYFSKKYLTEVLGSLKPGKVEKEIKDIVGLLLYCCVLKNHQIFATGIW